MEYRFILITINLISASFLYSQNAKRFEIMGHGSLVFPSKVQVYTIGPDQWVTGPAYGGGGGLLVKMNKDYTRGIYLGLDFHGLVRQADMFEYYTASVGFISRYQFYTKKRFAAYGFGEVTFNAENYDVFNGVVPVYIGDEPFIQELSSIGSVYGGNQVYSAGTILGAGIKLLNHIYLQGGFFGNSYVRAPIVDLGLYLPLVKIK